MLSTVAALPISLALGVLGAMVQPATATAVPPAPAPTTDTAPATATAPVATTAPAPTTGPSPAPAPTTVQTPAPAPAVDDAAWSALEGRPVTIDTAQGPVAGELLRSDGDTLVLVQDDGQVRTLPKAQALGVSVSPPPQGPTPAAPPATATASSGDPAQPMGGLDPKAGAPPAEEQAGEDEELTPAQQRRKDRREKREHALLGAMAMHGATYSHWRGDGINAGHASYAMDWGIGANLSPGFGMYAIAGGLFGARIDDKQIKANYGHVAALFAFGGKHYFSTVGAGVAFSRLRFADDRLDKDTGLSVPFKLVGKIPLPHKLYIGLGLTYEFAAVRGFSRFVNAIGGQIVVGRW